MRHRCHFLCTFSFRKDLIIGQNKGWWNGSSFDANQTHQCDQMSYCFEFGASVIVESQWNSQYVIRYAASPSIAETRNKANSSHAFFGKSVLFSIAHAVPFTELYALFVHRLDSLHKKIERKWHNKKGAWLIKTPEYFNWSKIHCKRTIFNGTKSLIVCLTTLRFCLRACTRNCIEWIFEVNLLDSRVCCAYFFHCLFCFLRYITMVLWNEAPKLNAIT